MTDTEGTTPAPKGATPTCPRRTPWCTDHTTELDQCVSTSIDVGPGHAVWLKLERDDDEPTVVVDGPPTGDGLTLQQSRKLASAIEALEYAASCDEVSWCAMTRDYLRDREAHQMFHQSETVHLAQGYEVYFTHDRGDSDAFLKLVLTGGPHDVEDTIYAAAATHLINAVSTDEAWDAMCDLVGRVSREQ